MPTDPIFGNEVARALESIPEKATTLQVASFLRTQLDSELARRAAELHELRFRGKGRFDPDYLAFATKRGFEQATPQRVAEARADFIANRSKSALVWDATSGIGADSIALARIRLKVVASDRDLHTLRYARANLEHHGADARVIVADAGTPPVTRADVVILDPDRRASGARSLDPEKWSPRFSRTLQVAQSFGGACVKLPPAFDPARVWTHTGAGIEAVGAWVWVSLRGSLCEVSLWLGELADGEPRRSVLALDGRGGVATLSGEPEEVSALTPLAAREIRWLAEPDPGIIRSGLLGNLARAACMAPLAPRIAYLGGDERPTSALLSSWRVLGTTPLDRRRVRTLLGQHDIGPLVVKKRGHPESADQLARRFRGPGKRRGLLVVTRLEHAHLALLCDPGPVVGDKGFEPPTSSL
jgi:hypothetical protein